MTGTRIKPRLTPEYVGLAGRLSRLGSGRWVLDTRTGTLVVRRRPGKRVVENPQFVAFTRRILRAYGRRVADGDIEALRSMAILTNEVEQATRHAVLGLREAGYTWQDIAYRLGISRQGAQLRYGDPRERGRLDVRLLHAAGRLSVATLVAVYADHWPGTPIPELCPGCGYRYPSEQRHPACPTFATVAPLLQRRQYEDQAVVRRLSGDQLAALHSAAANYPARHNGSARPALFPISTGGGEHR